MFKTLPECIRGIPPRSLNGIDIPQVAGVIFVSAKKTNEYVAAAVHFLAQQSTLKGDHKALLWRSLAEEIKRRVPGFVSDFFWDKDGNYIFAGALNEGAILVIQPDTGSVFTGNIPGGFLSFGIDTSSADLRKVS